MDPLTRKLFQPREARDKLRNMGGIMSSSPQLASTVAKFNVGGPIQAMAPQRSDLGGAMPLASAIHEPSGMMYGEMSTQQLSALANSGDRLAAEVLMMLQPSAGVQPSQGSGGFSLSNVGPNLETLTEPFIGTSRDAQRAEIEAQLENRNLSEFEREALETRLLGLSGEGFVADAGNMVRDSLGRIISAPGRIAGAGLSAIGATGPGAALLEAYDAGFYDSESPRYRNAPDPIPTRGPDDGTRGGSSVAPTITEGPTRGPDDGTRGGSPVASVAPDVTEVPVEPARNEASRKLLREERKAAPPAETPAPDLDFEDPSTFDTNFKTVMSRLEGVMGTGSKSSREDTMANLAMIGLAIAAGQSPDALTNIAQGALTGVQAIRADKKDREEQEKALRMLGITTAMDMTAAGDAAAATAARDEVGFQRDLQKLQEESRLAAAREIAELQERARLGIGTGEGGRDPRAIEDFVQNVYTEALKAASGVARPDDMGEGDTPEAYAARKANTARQYMGQQFPGTYGGGVPAADDLTEDERRLLGGA